MSHNQKSQCCQLEGCPQPQREAQDLVHAEVPMPEEEEATAAASFPSAILIPATPREVPEGGIPRFPQSPQRAPSPPIAMAVIPSSQSDEASIGHQEQGPFPRRYVDYPQSLLRRILGRKVAQLVMFLVLKYRVREPVTMAEILNSVIRNYQRYFLQVLSRASECLQLVFGIEVKEMHPSSYSYVLVTSLGLTYDGMLSDVQGMPKTGILIIVLFIIIKEGNRASEELVWEALGVMGVFPWRHHYVFGDPVKLITDDLVREQYLVYRQVPSRDPVRYEFLWGRRAHAETSKMKVLQYWSQVSGTDPRSFPSLYREALREQEEAAQARDAGRATRVRNRQRSRAGKCCRAPFHPRPGPM